MAVPRAQAVMVVLVPVYAVQASVGGLVHARAAAAAPSDVGRLLRGAATESHAGEVGGQGRGRRDAGAGEMQGQVRRWRGGEMEGRGRWRGRDR